MIPGPPAQGIISSATNLEGMNSTLNRYGALLCLLTFGWMLGATQRAQANPAIMQISMDPFTNVPAAHATEVESDNFAFGQTMIGVFQVGRYQDSNAGSTDIGWSTTNNGGKTWSFGFLPGITSGRGHLYVRVTDPAVAYDAKHRVWMIVSLPRGTSRGQTTYLVPIVSRSSDGLHWQNPVHIAPDSGDFMDKPWIVCDNGTSSRFFGNCYVEYIDVNRGASLLFSVSHDGGATWSTPIPTVDGASGNGGQPIVQRSGRVLVPYLSGAMESTSSIDGGKTWNASVLIANVNEHQVAGGIRDPGPLPSAEVDASGKAYVAWQDCSFRVNCSSNDIVFSTSVDGQRWSTVRRIPIDPRTSTLDHFLPGMGVDHMTSGANARLGVTFYYLANANCTFSTCRIFVGFIASKNGGATWNAPIQLAGPMQVGWLPNSDLGFMIGDYSSTSFIGPLARSTFPLAMQPSGSRFEQAIFTSVGLEINVGGIQLSSSGELPYRQMPRIPRWRPLLVVH